jgi:hypothetical protein
MASSKAVSIIRGSAVYKKKDGTLSISKDQKSILWIPLQPRDAENGLTIAVAEITSMKSTRDSMSLVLTPVRFAADTRVGNESDAEDLRKVT